jgi:hypothetical protein
MSFWCFTRGIENLDLDLFDVWGQGYDIGSNMKEKHEVYDIRPTYVAYRVSHY